MQKLMQETMRRRLLSFLEKTEGEGGENEAQLSGNDNRSFDLATEA